MKKLLLAALCLISLSSNAQINCNNIKASARAMAGLYSNVMQITYLNQTSKITTGKVSQMYIIDWGDNSNDTMSQWFNSIGRYYAIPGTYIIKMKYIVYDSTFNITCVDSTYDTVAVGAPYCDRLKASIAVSVSNGVATLVNNCNPDEAGFSVASYYYNWGDNSSGSTSKKTPPLTHSYTKSGTYKVSMIFTLGNAYKTCRDTTDTTLSVTVIPPDEISGYVYTDSPLTGPNDTIKLWLLKYDSASKLLTPVDSQLMAPIRYYLGYKFKNVAPGSYRMKAQIIGQPLATGNVPTYHDSNLVWNKARVINHPGGSTVGIVLYFRTGKQTTGPGSIGGKVQNSYTSQGIPGMNVLLMNGSGLPIAYDITDVNGDYSFSNLPLGTYYIHPEDLNYITTPATIDVSTNNTSHAGVSFDHIAGNKTIVLLGTGIHNISTGKFAFEVYPNPVQNTVHLYWDKISEQPAGVVITDISGKKVINTIVSMNSAASIDVHQLQPGLYFVTATTERGIAVHKLVIE